MQFLQPEPQLWCGWCESLQSGVFPQILLFRSDRLPRAYRDQPMRIDTMTLVICMKRSAFPLCADRLSSAGLNNCLLVGRITMSVKGMTKTCKTPATTHQNVAPASHAAKEDNRHAAANVTCMMVPR